MNTNIDITVVAQIVAGMVTVICALYFVYSSRGNNLINSIIMFIAAILILFSKGPMNLFKGSIANASIEVRSGVSEDTAIAAWSVANIQPFIKQTNEAIDGINKAIRDQDQRINNIIGAAKNPAMLSDIKKIETAPIQKIEISASQVGKTVLVFYKTNENLASSIVDLLQKKGFKSASAKSSLGEIKEWVTNTDPNNITIAANGDNQSLSNALKNLIVTDLALPSDTLRAVSDWSFRASDAQIYIF